MTERECPGCSGNGVPESINGVDVLRCLRCGGVFWNKPGHMTRFMANVVVPSRWCRCYTASAIQGGAVPPSVYFDFTIVAEDGSTDRMHGWYHPGCGITQTG